MVWPVEDLERVWQDLWIKTSDFIDSVKMMNKKELSEMSHDSAIGADWDFEIDDEEDEENIRNYASYSRTPSRASSVSSICSCLSCSLRGPTWEKRPSKLLQGYKCEEFYRYDCVLGEGSFSKVFLAESKAQKGGWVAVKEVKKDNLLKTKTIPNIDNGEYEDFEEDIISVSMMEQADQEINRLVDKEIRIMSALDHPHVVHLEEVFEEAGKVCFVMELAKGGEVFDRLVQRVCFDEMQTADLIVQLLCAMAYIHSQGIVHRDLKLENLLYYDDNDDSKIMVADFGLSDWVKVLADGTSPICGTPGYMAPEVIQRQSCTTKSDVWSVGVITYILLAGYPPFHVDHHSSNSSDADALLLKKIVNCDYKFIESTWKDISPQAIDFIQSLMSPDPNLRPSCEEALNHPWLTDRQNLEQRVAERRRKPSIELTQDCEEWSMGQQVAFVISVFVILGSYSALITYVFNIGKPSVILSELLSHMRIEYEDFSKVYNEVYEAIEDCIDSIQNSVVQLLNGDYWETLKSRL